MAVHQGASPHESLRVLQERIASAGMAPSEFMPSLEESLRALPDPARALTNLLRFLEAGFTGSLIRDFSAHPALLRVFLELVSQSQYLADILVRHPEWLRWLTTTGELRRLKSAREFSNEMGKALSAFENPARRRDAVARFHRRETLRIGAMEILGEASLRDVTDQLSLLADAVIDEAVNAAHRSMSAMTGTPFRHELAVIGLGKLGGMELNFSSDIDLLFVYEKDRTLRAPIGRSGTSHELHARLAESVVDHLTEISGGGHLYRVDMRLRPDGRSGPLALSRSGYRTYYETRGAAWERQMLIKARCVGGKKQVGERFLRDIAPFVYPRTSLASPWEDIASMKRAIEEEFHGEGNIKLGAGGIRDIEFLVQGLQLVHGGSREDLRSPNTLATIDALSRHRILPGEDADVLREAYSMFRTVEHRLQLLYGFQTHELPQSDVEFTMLSRKLGFADDAAFRAKLGACRAGVRSHFLAATQGGRRAGKSTMDDLGAMLSALEVATDHPSARNLAAAYRRSPSPEVTAKRMTALLSREGTRGVFREACASPRLCADLVRSVTASQLVYERLSSEPLLVESIVGQAGTLLTGKAPGWMDSLAEHPARFKMFNEVRSSIRYLTGRTGIGQFEAELSAAAEAVLERAYTLSGAEGKLLVIAAGRLGSREMGISSDLDLVLFYDEEVLSPDVAQALGRSFFDVIAASPKSYDVDVRLRPEGRSAPLVAGLSYFATYMRERAARWEVMAMSRTRPLAGPPPLAARFRKAVRAAPAPKGSELAAYVRDMRGRMEKERTAEEGVNVKIGAGGIADVEFIAQAGSILHGRSGGRKTSAVLRSLMKAGLLRARETHLLTEGLDFLRDIESRLRLNSPTATSVLRDEGAADIVKAGIPGVSDARELTSHVRGRMAVIRRTYDGILDRWGRT